MVDEGDNKGNGRGHVGLILLFILIFILLTFALVVVKLRFIVMNICPAADLAGDEQQV